MLGAFLTTIFFSLSSIFALRAVRIVGSTKANLARLFVAVFCLGAWAHLVPLLGIHGLGGKGLFGAGLSYFLLSGVLGMGLGDLAVFAALPRLGSRLTVVMTQCLAAPIAALAEWMWLGTRLSGAQMLCGFVILGGVTTALSPSRKDSRRVTVRASGIVFGTLSAVGQGLGAVFSRKAYTVMKEAGQTLDGGTATYHRIIGGLAVTLVFLLARRLTQSTKIEEGNPRIRGFRRWSWTVVNALCGAVIGVSCYQWALGTTASGIVLPIVATTPLVIVPLSFWLDGERPSSRSLLGGAVAVAGAVALARVS